MAGHQPPADGGHPGGRWTGGHPGGRRAGGHSGGRYTTDGHTCSRYGGSGALGIGEHKIPGGVEREREIKRKLRGRERDNERGARERGATKRERD